MSNFICSECGMTNIDCGGAGYKTPKEIELEKKLDIAVKVLGYYAQCKHINLDLMTIREDCSEFEMFEDGEHARKALKEIDMVGTSMSLAKEEE